MLENTLLTRCMVSASILLQMAIGMRVLGMREEGKALECIRLGMERRSLDTGRMEFLMYRVRRVSFIPIRLLLSTTPKYLMQCRFEFFVK